MSKHYLMQKQNGRLIKKTVKDWAGENKEKFPKFKFRNGSIAETPTSEQIDAQLKREGYKREIFNGDYYCYNPNEINGNDLITANYMKGSVIKADNQTNNSKDNKETDTVNKIIMHPWLKKYPIDSKSKNLIIGTHPPMPYNNDNLQYFYGNLNEFWRLLDKVYPTTNLFNNGNPNLDVILNFQNEKSISITDMVYKTHVDRFSTDDEMGKISDIDFNPFLKEWLDNSIVDTIYFTSFGGTNSAKNLFKRWFKSNYDLKGVITKSHVNEIVLPRNRKIQLIDLFSPSPNGRRSMNSIQEYIEWSFINNSTDYDMFRVDWYKMYLPK